MMMESSLQLNYPNRSQGPHLPPVWDPVVLLVLLKNNTSFNEQWSSSNDLGTTPSPQNHSNYFVSSVLSLFDSGTYNFVLKIINQTFLALNATNPALRNFC